ncbi:hypothetical protein ABK040_000995 [Willaertia magna]
MANKNNQSKKSQQSSNNNNHNQHHHRSNSSNTDFSSPRSTGSGGSSSSSLSSPTFSKPISSSSSRNNNHSSEFTKEDYNTCGLNNNNNMGHSRRNTVGHSGGSTNNNGGGHSSSPTNNSSSNHHHGSSNTTGNNHNNRNNNNQNNDSNTNFGSSPRSGKSRQKNNHSKYGTSSNNSTKSNNNSNTNNQSNDMNHLNNNNSSTSTTHSNNSNNSSHHSSSNSGGKRNPRVNALPPLNTNISKKTPIGNHHSSKDSSLSVTGNDSMVLEWSTIQAKGTTNTKPAPRGFHSCTLVGDKLYIIGGDNRLIFFKDVCIFDLKSKCWIKLSEKAYLPVPRTGHTTVLFGNKLYLFGGKNMNYYTSDLYIFDLSTHTWEKEELSKKKVVPRAAHSCCVIDNKMYVFGGITTFQIDGKSTSDYLDTLSIYDFSQKKWKNVKKKGQSPTARAGHACCVIEKNIYVFGGRQGTKLLNDLYKFNIDTEKWTKINAKGEIPLTRAGHTITSYKEKIILFGGSDWKKYFSDVFVFDTPTRTWVKCISKGMIPLGRFWHTAVLHEDNLIIYGGGNTELVDDICNLDLKPLEHLSEIVALTPQPSVSPLPLPELPAPKPTSMMKIKVVYKGEMRVFTNVPRDISYEELKQFISTQYGFNVVLKYVEQSEEKDEITIKSDEELATAIEMFAEDNKNLRLDICKEEEVSPHNSTIEDTKTNIHSSNNNSSSNHNDHKSLLPIGSSDNNLFESSEETPLFKWQKGEFLGQGAYGYVVRGLNIQTGEFMAVKIINIPRNEMEKTVAEVTKEINLMKDLKHENIVRYLGAELNRRKGKLYIYLELVDGGSLQEILKHCGKLHESVVRQYTKQILFGLKYLHDKNIIHRDIKGANILVDAKNGTVKLADFGHSKRLTDLTQSVNIKGTPMWMAPELIRENKCSKASDIWSLGCVIVEMCTGDLPYPQYSHLEPHQIMIAIATERKPPPIPEDLTEEGKQFLRKCFEIDPDLRATVDDLLQEPFLRPLRPDEIANLKTVSFESDSDSESDSAKNNTISLPEDDEEEDEDEEDEDFEEDDEEDMFEDEEEEEEDEITDSDDESITAETPPPPEDKSSRSIYKQLENIQANNPVLPMNLRGPQRVNGIMSPPSLNQPHRMRGVLTDNVNNITTNPNSSRTPLTSFNQLNPFTFQNLTIGNVGSTRPSANTTASHVTNSLNIGSSSSALKATEDDVLSYLMKKSKD